MPTKLETTASDKVDISEGECKPSAATEIPPPQGDAWDHGDDPADIDAPIPYRLT